ncbi:HNH endonuclease domain-containing protein [Thermosynechococcus sp. FA-CM-4201]
MDTPYSLPSSESLDIATFSRLLDDTTNSYKFLFFISLLDILSSRLFEVTSPISLKDLAIEMLVNAWYPHSVFRLSFGLRDMVTEKLNSLNLTFDNLPLKIKNIESDKTVIREAIKSKNIDERLTRYVPFRLIRPFFRELSGLKDQQVNREVKKLAERLFEERKPLYKFSQNNTAILIHPEWAAYIQTNYQIVRGWVSWCWLQYMQKRNPNTAAIVNKLFPPRERESLQWQTSYWRTVIENCEDLRCIYSNQILELNDISLDHYLPWSFVAHNHLWNLIPVPKSVNSSKSDNIPDDIYFERFIKIQHTGLVIFYNHSSPKKWNNYIESYLVDLGFSSKEELLNFESLKRQYKIKFMPLIALAVSQGFNSNWRYI